MTTLVLFGAAWCGPCKTTRPRAALVADQAGAQFEYVDVDDSRLDPRVAGILSVPVLRVYDERGAILAEHVGGASVAQVRALLGE
ncbi:thioredoxin family protein [Streptomyces mirabilis]